jgi:hypothetical protein
MDVKHQALGEHHVQQGDGKVVVRCIVRIDRVDAAEDAGGQQLEEVAAIRTELLPAFLATADHDHVSDVHRLRAKVVKAAGNEGPVGGVRR